MLLPSASHILRRLQNSIYPFRPSTEEIDETLAFDRPTPIMETEIETLDGRSLDLSNFNFSGQPNINISSSSLFEDPSAHIPSPLRTPSPSQESIPTRHIQNSSDGRRQSSNPLIRAPDLNFETSLRKRILEIQSLDLPEHSKAHKVQVNQHSIET